MSYHKQQTTKNRRRSDTDLLGLARIGDVEVDQVGVFEASVPNGSNDCTGATYGFMEDNTAVSHIRLFPVLQRDGQLAVNMIRSIAFNRVCGAELVLWVCVQIIHKPSHINLMRMEAFHKASQGHHFVSSLFYRRQHKHWRMLKRYSCKKVRTVKLWDTKHQRALS